jgi:hypothetical protein
LRREAIWTLTQQSNPERFVRLVEIATDPKEDPSIRSIAIAGLAPAARDYSQPLARLAASSDPTIARERHGSTLISTNLRAPKDNGRSRTRGRHGDF